MVDLFVIFNSFKWMVTGIRWIISSVSAIRQPLYYAEINGSNPLTQFEAQVYYKMDSWPWSKLNTNSSNAFPTFPYISYDSSLALSALRFLAKIDGDFCFYIQRASGLLLWSMAVSPTHSSAVVFPLRISLQRWKKLTQ